MSDMNPFRVEKDGKLELIRESLRRRFADMDLVDKDRRKRQFELPIDFNVHDPDPATGEESQDKPEMEEFVWLHRNGGVGKGYAGVLKLLEELKKEIGAPKETGGNMDKKKSNVRLIASRFEDSLRTERRDEFGRIMAPNQEFAIISQKFRGKGPSKREHQQRKKRLMEERMKRMMEEAQAQLRTLVLTIPVNNELVMAPNQEFPWKGHPESELEKRRKLWYQDLSQPFRLC